MKGNVERIKSASLELEEIRRVQRVIWNQLNLDIRKMEKRQENSSILIWLLRTYYEKIKSTKREKEFWELILTWLKRGRL